MSPPARFKPETRRLIDLPLQVGESPTWDARTGALWFVDIHGPAVLRLLSDGRLDRFAMPSRPGCLALCESGRIAVAIEEGVHLLDPATGSLQFLANPGGGQSACRLNDGKVGPDGCLWVGEMDESKPAQQPRSRLFRVAPDGSVRQVLEGLLTSNGLAWSPDGRRMYHSDSSGLYVQAFAFDPASGEIGPAERLHDNAPDEGRPDGAAMDAQGFYWSAGVRAGRLNRMAPSGEIVEVWELPAMGCTMPCFGGPGLRTLYVTSLQVQQGPGAGEPGTLLAFDAPVSGAPVPRFRL